MKRAVRFKIDNLLENFPLELGLAIGRQAHDLVFARVDPETEVIGESGIEQAERMGKMLLSQHFDAIAGATANAGGSPFTNAIDGEDGGFIERRWKKSGGSMGLVMLGKKNLSVELDLITDDLFDPHFAFDPDRHRFEK